MCKRGAGYNNLNMYICFIFTYIVCMCTEDVGHTNLNIHHNPVIPSMDRRRDKRDSDMESVGDDKANTYILQNIFVFLKIRDCCTLQCWERSRTPPPPTVT